MWIPKSVQMVHPKPHQYDSDSSGFQYERNKQNRKARIFRKFEEIIKNFTTRRNWKITINSLSKLKRKF